MLVGEEHGDEAKVGQVASPYKSWVCCSLVKGAIGFVKDSRLKVNPKSNQERTPLWPPMLEGTRIAFEQPRPQKSSGTEEMVDSQKEGLSKGIFSNIRIECVAVAVKNPEAKKRSASPRHTARSRETSAASPIHFCPVALRTLVFASGSGREAIIT